VLFRTIGLMIVNSLFLPSSASKYKNYKNQTINHSGMAGMFPAQGDVANT